MKTVSNVEIFRAGTWRGVGSPPGGDRYSKEDLQAMVDAFNQGAIRPKIKITHGADTEQVDVGEVSNLRLVGDKLQGDFVSLDSSLYELMKKGLFKSRSAEVLWNMRDHAGKTWRRVLKAVALLAPGQKPAVTGLAEGYQFEALYCYTMPHEGGRPMSIFEKGKGHYAELDKKNEERGRRMSKASMEVNRLCQQYIQEGKAEGYEGATELVQKNHRALWNTYMSG